MAEFIIRTYGTGLVKLFIATDKASPWDAENVQYGPEHLTMDRHFVPAVVPWGQAMGRKNNYIWRAVPLGTVYAKAPVGQQIFHHIHPHNT